MTKSDNERPEACARQTTGKWRSTPLGRRVTAGLFMTVAVFVACLATAMFIDQLPSWGYRFVLAGFICAVAALACVEGSLPRAVLLSVKDFARKRGLDGKTLLLFVFGLAFFYLANVIAGTIVFADAFEADYGALATVCLVFASPMMLFGQFGLWMVPPIEAALTVFAAKATLRKLKERKSGKN